MLGTKELYNLIYDSYEIETIDKKILSDIYYVQKDRKDKIWMYDDIKTFKKLGKNIISPSKELVYNHSKIIKYIINIHPTDIIIKLMARLHLNIYQINKFISKLNHDQFVTFTEYFFIFLRSYYSDEIGYLPAANIIINNKWFEDINVLTVLNQYKGPQLLTVATKIFLRQPLVQNYVQLHNIKLNEFHTFFGLR